MRMFQLSDNYQATISCTIQTHENVSAFSLSPVYGRICRGVDAGRLWPDLARVAHAHIVMMMRMLMIIIIIVILMIIMIIISYWMMTIDHHDHINDHHIIFDDDSSLQ